jgi:ferredoxin-NADP reductase
LSLSLAPTENERLPAFTAGSHIDLHLADNIVRQYSLCGATNDVSSYRIAIRSVEGGLASRYIHSSLRPGDIVHISEPRNNFPLDDAKNYVFIAGGIGITPIIPMLREACIHNRRWSLLYCNHSNEDTAFVQELVALPGEISMHISSAGSRLDVAQRLAVPVPDTLVYCCGPERLMVAVESATKHWPENSIRFEWFTPRCRPDGETSDSFEVVCAASGVTLTVPKDKSILEVLKEAGLDAPSSCEQGVCGTCEMKVLSGTVDHRDSILSPSERATDASMMVCVSRARGSKLVLDI